MTQFLPSIRALGFLTVLTGLIYPLAMTGVGQVFWSHQVNGSVLEVNGSKVGSEWIAQKFERPEYFHPRPSAGDYGTTPSGASNLGPTSATLKKRLDEARAQGASGSLLFTSGSGLDPHIGPEDALLQMKRISEIRSGSHLNVEKMSDVIRKLIFTHTEEPQFGILGERRVNVLQLNLALDQELGLANR